MSKRIILPVISAILVASVETLGQLNIPGADGSDGVLELSGSTQIDLGLAASLCDCNGDGRTDEPCRWDCPSPVPGQGVYDSEKWAVVFKYTDINLSGGTLTFLNHPKRAPVVWLVAGSATINGTVSLNGQSPNQATIPEPGPGGFRGGAPHLSDTSPGSGGFGPGGGHYVGGAGSYGTGGSGNSGPVYGNASLLPLIGGSGGSIVHQSWVSCSGWADPGAGGGALVIACVNSLILNGQIRANGGNGGPQQCALAGPGRGGAGGAIRVIAETISGTGTFRARGGSGGGGAGRIRVEANSIELTDTGDPPYSRGFPLNPPLLWLPDDAPRVAIVDIGGQAVPTDPGANLGFPTDMVLSTDEPLIIQIEASSVPPDWQVEVRIVRLDGADQVIGATMVSGDATASLWEAEVIVPMGASAVQVNAFEPSMNP